MKPPIALFNIRKLVFLTSIRMNSSYLISIPMQGKTFVLAERYATTIVHEMIYVVLASMSFSSLTMNHYNIEQIALLVHCSLRSLNVVISDNVNSLRNNYKFLSYKNKKTE
jgi:hypothetical protein